MENRGEFDPGNWKRHFQRGVGLKWDGMGGNYSPNDFYFGD